MSDAGAGGPLARLLMIQVDCHDPDRLAAFWSEILGVPVAERLGDPPQYVFLERTEPAVPFVSFQRVPEPKTAKNRVHLDLRVTDVEAVTARVEALGGRRRDDHDFQYAESRSWWRRMADVEDNEFCLIFDA